MDTWLKIMMTIAIADAIGDKLAFSGLLPDGRWVEMYY